MLAHDHGEVAGVGADGGGAVGGRQHVAVGDEGAATPAEWIVTSSSEFEYLPGVAASSADEPHLPGVLVDLGLLTPDDPHGGVGGAAAAGPGAAGGVGGGGLGAGGGRRGGGVGGPAVVPGAHPAQEAAVLHPLVGPEHDLQGGGRGVAQSLEPDAARDGAPVLRAVDDEEVSAAEGEGVAGDGDVHLGGEADGPAAPGLLGVVVGVVGGLDGDPLPVAQGVVRVASQGSVHLGFSSRLRLGAALARLNVDPAERGEALEADQESGQWQQHRGDGDDEGSGGCTDLYIVIVMLHVFCGWSIIVFQQWSLLLWVERTQGFILYQSKMFVHSLFNHCQSLHSI